MPNYQQGKVYKILSNDELCYIGSTTLPLLCMRMAEHRNGYKRLKSGGKISNISSYILFDKYGVDNCRIELLEAVSCNSKDELTRREGHYIRLLNCVNKNIAGRTKQEWYEANPGYYKKWCEDNPDYKKKWHEANPNCNKEYQRKWCDSNRDTKLQLNRKWYEANKLTLAEKYTCVCGSIIRKGGKIRHELSQKHKDYCTSVASPCSIVK